MPRSHATIDSRRPHNVGEWVHELERPPSLQETIGGSLAFLAMLAAGLLTALGTIHISILAGTGERLAALNEALLLGGVAICAVCALRSATSKRAGYTIVGICLATALAVAVAGWGIHGYLVPERQGWFGSYGKPLTLWLPAVGVMAFSLLAATISRWLPATN